MISCYDGPLQLMLTVRPRDQVNNQVNDHSFQMKGMMGHRNATEYILSKCTVNDK